METNTNNNRPGANVPPAPSQTNDQLTNMLLQEMMFYFGIALVLLKEGLKVLFNGISQMLSLD